MTVRATRALGLTGALVVIGLAFTAGRHWDSDADGYNTFVDCDDQRADVHPDAPEVCNDRDDDCDGLADNDAMDALIWFSDSDGDDHGDPAKSRRACSKPNGFVRDSTDCGPDFPWSNPTASEVCDQRDNDCDGLVDEGTWRVAPDADRDGYGRSRLRALTCEQMAATQPAAVGERYSKMPSFHSSSPMRGFANQSGDCNDEDFEVHPGASEVCNARDDDCDGRIDRLELPAPVYRDEDGDGYGAGDVVRVEFTVCLQEGLSRSSDDCDDSFADVVFPSSLDVDLVEELRAFREVQDATSYGGRLPLFPNNGVGWEDEFGDPDCEPPEGASFFDDTWEEHVEPRSHRRREQKKDRRRGCPPFCPRPIPR
jgi:hypothetical protein